MATKYTRPKVVTIMIDLPHSCIVDAMATADTRYWCSRKPLRSGWRVIETNDGFHARTFDVSLVDLARGAGILAWTAPIHFGYLFAGRADATTGDLLLQLSIFGIIKYS